MSEWQDEDVITTTFKSIKMAREESFEDGVRYALQRLEEVFGEEITETDLWLEYNPEEETE